MRGDTGPEYIFLAASRAVEEMHVTFAGNGVVLFELQMRVLRSGWQSRGRDMMPSCSPSRASQARRTTAWMRSALAFVIAGVKSVLSSSAARAV